MYKLLSVFRSAGYNSQGAYLRGDSALITGNQTLGGLFDSRTNRTASPVNGIPIPARHTLLAQLLGNSKTAAKLLKGNMDGTFDGISTREGIRSTKEVFGDGRNRGVQNAKAAMRDGLFSSDRLKGKLISVEIECYKDYWDSHVRGSGVLTEVVHDGSLSPGGREIRRISWANETGRLTGLLGLESYVKNAWVNKSCGLHVHIDARHLPKPGEGTPYTCDAAETYDRLTMLYPVLKKLVPRSRWNNKYCKFNNNRQDSSTYRCPSNGQRYAAINWCSYRTHKTIEFRLGSGSTNLVKIESWALLCKFLVDWCSVRHNTVPTRWAEFLAIMPGWMKSWCVLRNLKLHGGLEGIDARIVSAADYKIDSGVMPTE